MVSSNGREVALITGGGTGIGYACAEALAERGWTVVISGRRADVLEQSRRELAEKHPNAELIAQSADVRDPGQVTRLVDSVVTEHGQLDALICAAAVYEAAPGTELTTSAWDRTVEIVLRGTALAAFAAARHMTGRGRGRIVLIASIAANVSEVNQAPYNAAKAGVVSLARSLAVELSESGVTVNAVSPGWVRTPLTEADVAGLPPEVWRRICPIARVGEPGEVANLVRYLISEAPPFLTGSSIVIDGGQTAMAAMP